MAPENEDWGPLFGFRRDIDLNQRWWHRLAKVLYFVVLGINALILWAVSSDIKPDQERENVRITGTLSETLREANTSIPNVIPMFLSLPGRLGNMDWSTGNIGFVWEDALEKSWCTPDADAHLVETANHLSSREYASVVFPSQLQQTIQKAHPRERRLCWFAIGIETVDVGSVIKYEFTGKAKSAAWMKVLGYIFVGHLVLLNVYYRGLVYIICGPRKPGVKNTWPPDDDDTFYDDIDADVDEKEKT